MATPMLDGIELKAVQVIRQEIEQDYRRHRIAGLDGTLHQHIGRRSHRVTLAGLLLTATAADDLAALQNKAAAGDEVTFTADIATALDIDRMVIEAFAAEQAVGVNGQTAYAIVLAESPPLPPPAEVGSFGGLGDFGLGDLGFDAGALGDLVSDIADQATSVMELASAAMGAIDSLTAIASLGDLGDVAKPVTDALGAVSQLDETVASVRAAATRLLG